MTATGFYLGRPAEKAALKCRPISQETLVYTPFMARPYMATPFMVTLPLEAVDYTKIHINFSGFGD